MKDIMIGAIEKVEKELQKQGKKVSFEELQDRWMRAQASGRRTPVLDMIDRAIKEELENHCAAIAV